MLCILSPHSLPWTPPFITMQWVQKMIFQNAGPSRRRCARMSPGKSAPQCRRRSAPLSPTPSVFLSPMLFANRSKSCLLFSLFQPFFRSLWLSARWRIAKCARMYPGDSKQNIWCFKVGAVFPGYWLLRVQYKSYQSCKFQTFTSGKSALQWKEKSVKLCQCQTAEWFDNTTNQYHPFLRHKTRNKAFFSPGAKAGLSEGSREGLQARDKSKGGRGDGGGVRGGGGDHPEDHHNHHNQGSSHKSSCEAR